ncbi:hypothetical protein BH11MYX4_BH11MYX4_23540 [soil metagenome]
MNRPVDEPLDAANATTILDRVRPTVVVRRRIYEPPPSPKTVVAHGMRADDEDESGPPSSVNVGRALASLRVDELRRLEEIVSADDDPPVPSVRVIPSAAAVPTLRMRPSIPIGDLAAAMNVPSQELVTALVTRGFFSVTVKSVLARETGRAAAAMFGWQVEDDDTPIAHESKPAKKKSAASASAKVVGAASKTTAKAKPAKKRTGRRGG